MRYLLAFKRVGFSFILLILSLLLIPFLSVIFADRIHEPAAAFVCEGIPDEDASLFCSLLLDQGFVEESSEDALTIGISQGLYDCGIVIPGEIRSLLETKGPEEILTFISSPSSLYDDLWRSSAASCFFSVYAPYITADLLTPYGIETDSVLSLFRERMASPALFRFRISSMEGTLLSSRSYRDSLFVFSYSFTAFFVLLFGIALPVVSSSEALSKRIGILASIRYAGLPELLLRFFLYLSAAFLSCFFCGFLSLFPSLILSSVSVLLICFVPVLLFRDRTRLSLFCSFLVLLSLLCFPLFSDLSLIFPFLSVFRLFLPPLWFSQVLAATVFFPISGFISILLSLSVLLVRMRLTGKK